MKTAKSDMAEIWHKLNVELTEAERRKFNEWRFALWLDADRQRDLMRFLTIKPHQMKHAENVYKGISEIPILEK